MATRDDLMGAMIFDTGIPADAPVSEESHIPRDGRETLVSRMIEQAISWYEEHVEPEQAKATEYYMAAPFGDEKEGRSQVVSADVRDTVHMIMPSLMEIFFGTEKVWEFKPRSIEDTEAAEQATDYVNYIVREENRGMMVFYSAFMDALVRKVGPIKWWHEEEYEVLQSTHTGLSPAAALMLVQSATEVESYAEHEDGTVDLVIQRMDPRPCIKIDAIPPDEHIHSPDARSIADARLVGHVREMPANELVEMGVDPKIVKRARGRMATDSDDLESSRRVDGGSHDTDVEDAATKPVPVAEVYVKMRVADMDEGSEMGDDVDQRVALHKCFMLGGGSSWEFAFPPEIVDEVPMTCFGPSPEPHAYEGLSIADLVMDIQRIKSQIWRGILDSLASHLDPAIEVVEGEVNMADVLNQERGRVIRARRPGMMREVTTEFVGGDALPVLGVLDDMRSSRTGVTKQSAGLDPDVLQSTTKAAVTATLSAAQQRIKLIARIFAETGMRDVARGVLRLVIRHQDRPKVVRLRNKWVEIDPRHWDATMDVQVNVGLGVGNVEERFLMMSQLVEKQEMHIQSGSPMVGFENLRAGYEALFEVAGRKDIDRFIKTPEEIQQILQQQAQQPPTPSDAERLERVEMAKLEQRMAEARLEAEVDIIQAQIAAGVKMNEAQIKARLDAARLGLEREKAEVDAVTKGSA